LPPGQAAATRVIRQPGEPRPVAIAPSDLAVKSTTASTITLGWDALPAAMTCPCRVKRIATA
jgi:hypothetical protein